MSASVGIIMGSDSDLPVMQAAASLLDELGLEYEIDIVSAHRTPDKLHDHASSAEARGIKVIIAGASGAAHLPRMAAAISVLPVIGVPVSATKLDGMDALLSIAQMPAGTSAGYCRISHTVFVKSNHSRVRSGNRESISRWRVELP